MPQDKKEQITALIIVLSFVKHQSLKESESPAVPGSELDQQQGIFPENNTTHQFLERRGSPLESAGDESDIDIEVSSVLLACDVSDTVVRIGTGMESTMVSISFV